MPPNSILLTITGKNLGDVAINKEPMATNQNFMCIETDEGIPSHFMFNLIRAKRSHIESLGSGTAYNMLTQSSFEGLEVAIPPSPDMLKYEDTVSSFYERIHHNLRENDTLADIRETLMPKLLSGDVRLSPGTNKVAPPNN
jgi:type I restriction enzyme S subunit